MVKTTTSLSLRFSRVLPSFRSCRSKASIAVTAAPPPATIRRVAAVIDCSGCRCAPLRRARCNPAADAGDLSRAYLWRREETWHVVTAADESTHRLKIDSDDGGILFPPAAGGRARLRPRASACSTDSDWHSSDGIDDMDGGGETKTLLSSFETDAPENVLWRMRTLGRSGCCPTPEMERLAVVKRSADPRGDFRRSMVLEQQIYDPDGLEQLLQCFLSLNSRDHRRAIVTAFSDIWGGVFPNTTLPRAYYK